MGDFHRCGAHDERRKAKNLAARRKLLGIGLCIQGSYMKVPMLLEEAAYDYISGTVDTFLNLFLFSLFEG